MADFTEDARLYIGSNSPSKLIKRAKGIRFRRYIWIDKDRNVTPIVALESSHLFMACKAIMKYANTNRWEKINKLHASVRSGKDHWGKPISKEECLRQIDILKDKTIPELAEKEYLVYGDVMNEMLRRGLDPSSDEHAMMARKEVEDKIKRFGRLM